MIMQCFSVGNFKASFAEILVNNIYTIISPEIRYYIDGKVIVCSTSY